MKKCILAFVMSCMLLVAACGGKDLPAGDTPAATATPDTIILPGGSSEPAPTSAPATPAPTAPAEDESKLLDPSIYVIHAQSTWQQELAEGYYANYECELYLHKIDANDNRVSTGAYEGYFWMNVTLDAADFIKEMLGDAPIDMAFEGGGEALSDNFGIYLNITDDKAWMDYTIPDDSGNPRPLSQDMPVARGSFVAVAKNVYLAAQATGAQGEKLDYSDFPKDQLTDISYVVNMQADSAEASGVRKVVFYFTDSNGNTFTVEGTMTRLPGYPEDVSDYLNSQAYQDASRKHFEQ